MTALYPHSWTQYLGILLVFLRLLGLFLLFPVFSHSAIPATIKVVVGLSISLAIHGLVRPHLGDLPESMGGLMLLSLRETAIGLLMGFAAYVTMEGVHLAAQFIGYQMGFGTAGLIDPLTQSSVSILVPLHGWIAIVVFLGADMHHDVLRLFVRSFELSSELGVKTFEAGALLATITTLTAKLFFIAVQMAAPFTLLLLLINAAVGLLARVLPQMNLLFFSFPVTILFGLAGMFVVAPDFLEYLNNLLGEMTSDVLLVLRSF